jgi:hypothetical protein
MGWLLIVRPVAVIPRRYPDVASRALVDLVDLPAWRASLFDYKDLLLVGSHPPDRLPLVGS